jgi:hypothetical protein
VFAVNGPKVSPPLFDVTGGSAAVGAEKATLCLA